MRPYLTLLMFMVIGMAVKLSPCEGTIIMYAADLSGAAEAPPNASPATGTVLATYDSVAKTLAWTTTFSGLLAPTTVAHFHATTALPLTGIAGVATQPGTLTGFPPGVMGGTFGGIIDLTLPGSYTGGFLAANGGTAAGAEAGLISAFDSQRAYFNIHSTAFPAGEIRGFMTAVPEPGSVLLLTAGAAGFIVRRFRRKPTVAKELIG